MGCFSFTTVNRSPRKTKKSVKELDKEFLALSINDNMFTRDQCFALHFCNVLYYLNID